MNREDIIRMAEEAGAIHYWHLSNLERFAALVASAERRECAKLCAEVGMWPLVDEIEARGET